MTLSKNDRCNDHDLPGPVQARLGAPFDLRHNPGAPGNAVVLRTRGRMSVAAQPAERVPGTITRRGSAFPAPSVSRACTGMPSRIRACSA
jgi:hypothetical protein